VIVGVLANPELRNVGDIANEVISAFGDDVEVLVEETLAKILDCQGQPLEEMEVDVMVTVGGDGTILHALQRNGAAIAGINAGRLGFLAEISKDRIREMVGRIKAGDYVVEERLKLQVIRDDERLPDCMNEMVLHTSHVSKMRHFELLVNSKPALNVRADGLIVSTPTGSTSYAMSVGGPIIDPRVDAFVVAPIAPFNLAVRPLVIPASAKMEIRNVKARDCVLVLDGQQEYEVGPNDVIRLSRSENTGRFVRFEEDFYARAWEKLRMDCEWPEDQ